MVDKAHQIVLRSGDRWLRLAWLMALAMSLENEQVALQMAQGMLITIEIS